MALKQSKSHQRKDDENLFERVYYVTRLIPAGRITSYGAIARYIGSPGAARMVGWALNGSHNVQPPLPAHRVVNRIGLLSGKHQFRYPELMQQLLESEGVKIENDRVVEFKKLFWDPSSELI